MSTLKPCLVCGIATPNSRCPAHGTTGNGKSASERGYGSEWRRLRAMAIHLHPYCTDCGTTGAPDNPLTGDHLRWPAVTLDDVEVVCRRCNSKRGASTGDIPMGSRTQKTPVSNSPIYKREGIPGAPVSHADATEPAHPTTDMGGSVWSV